MAPFNIKINYHSEEISFTILPENDYFLVIYFGGVFGALHQKVKQWVQLPNNEIAPGPLPPYEKAAPGERLEIDWSPNLVKLIGTQISAQFKGKD